VPLSPAVSTALLFSPRCPRGTACSSRLPSKTTHAPPGRARLNTRRRSSRPGSRLTIVGYKKSVESVGTVAKPLLPVNQNGFCAQAIHRNDGEATGF
jgi:hypothetical protein